MHILANKIKITIDGAITYALAKHPLRTNLMLILQLGMKLATLAPTAIPQITQLYNQIYALLQNAILSTVPQPILDVITQIINSEPLQYIQYAQVLDNILSNNQPFDIETQADAMPSTRKKAYSLPQQSTANTSTLPADPQQVQQMELMQLLLTRQGLLRYLSQREKRLLMLTISELFSACSEKEELIKGLSGLLYPPPPKTALNRTVTIIVTYIPLLVRCLLSPLTRSFQPWHELANKLIKDLTRIVHAISRLTNTFFNLVVRMFIRAPADILVNEVAARIEGAICKNEHRISQTAYRLSQYCNQSMEQLRQQASVKSDVLRRMASAPAPQAALQKASAYLSAAGLFAQPKKVDHHNSTADEEYQLRTMRQGG